MDPIATAAPIGVDQGVLGLARGLAAIPVSIRGENTRGCGS